jgi:hypothetical protein
MVTDYRQDEWGSIPDRGIGIFFWPLLQDRLGPTQCPVGSGGPFPGA